MEREQWKQRLRQFPKKLRFVHEEFHFFHLLSRKHKISPQTIQSPLAAGTVPSTPEDLIRVTKNVTIATAKAVAAGTSNLQSDIVAAANIGRRAISEMLSVCRSVAWSCAETYDLRQRTLDAGASVAISYRDLLQGVLKGCSADDRMHLSRRVAKCVTDLVAMAQLLKGSDWIDPEDPTVIAENELLGAAASIDAAAKKLANLRPRQQNDIKVMGLVWFLFRLFYLKFLMHDGSLVRTKHFFSGHSILFWWRWLQ